MRYNPLEQKNAELLLETHLNSGRLALFPRLYRWFFRHRVEQCLLPEVVQASYVFSLQSLMRAFDIEELSDAPTCEVRSDSGCPQFQIEWNRIFIPGNLPLYHVPLSMAEELSHYFRGHYAHTIGMSYVDTYNTQEFFGAVGRAVVLRDIGERNAEQWDLPSSEFPGSQAWSNASIVPRLRAIRHERRACAERMEGIRRGRKTAYEICDVLDGEGPDPSLFLMGNEMRQWDKLAGELHWLEHRRRALLQHARGIQFGGLIELQKIANLATLFSLPDAEVRRRFFRRDPDLSGLEKQEDTPKF